MQPMVTRWPPVTREELQRLREELGLTQEQLAEEVGVHRVTVARWENGDRGIPEPVARLLEKIRAERKRRKR
jgi:transcriptional regulator with XRE-family HTH domain